ncbi:hypothetical protein C8J56DRAFT_537581 [Mycena floridula]|nr:hypothetical protein C8J56DRAFT_537581 [Mycena floridula]
MSTFLAFRSVALSICRRQSCASTSNLFSTSTAAFAAAGRARNKRIPFENVTVIDEQGGLAPGKMSQLLETIPKSKFVELVRESPPMVKIIDKEEARAKVKLKKDREKEMKRRNQHKEFQLSWSSAEGDVAHKVERVKEMLAQGALVDVVFAPKPKAPRLKPHEMEVRVDKFLAQLEGTGYTLRTPTTFQRGMAAISLRGLVGDEIAQTD